jgi:hypothetical protein
MVAANRRLGRHYMLGIGQVAASQVPKIIVKIDKMTIDDEE